MKSRSEVRRYLHDHIVGAMHLGQLHAGDRLPGVRKTARELGANTRTVRAAYEALALEGLVEVRDRSGVYVARQEDRPLAAQEKTDWLSDVVLEAWRRRIPIATLPLLVERATTVREVFCGLVDDIEDSIVALRYELEHEWGYTVRLVLPHTLEANALRATMDVDFLATTQFHAAVSHATVEPIGTPLVVLTVHPALRASVRGRLEEGTLTVVAVDERFADRMRVVYAPDDPARIRFVSARDAVALERLDPREPIMVTRAASALAGPLHAPLIFPHSPTISAESARALSRMLVRWNMQPPASRRHASAQGAAAADSTVSTSSHPVR